MLAETKYRKSQSNAPKKPVVCHASPGPCSSGRGGRSLARSPLAFTPGVLVDEIHPPQDLARGKIPLHGVRGFPGMIVRTAPQRRAEIMPAGERARVSRRIRRIPPHKKKRVGTHPHSGGPALHRLPIEGIEPLPA